MNRADNKSTYDALNPKDLPAWCYMDSYSNKKTKNNSLSQLFEQIFDTPKFIEIPMLYIHTVTFKVNDFKHDRYYVVTNTEELDPYLVAFAHTKMSQLHGKGCQHIGTSSIKGINMETANTSIFITKPKEVKS